MTTKLTIIVKLNNGEAMTFKDAVDFSIMTQGVLFIQMPFAKAENRLGRILRGVETKDTRSWIPFQQIKNIEILTTKTINEQKELDKYEKFLEHGIDMTVTKISHTEPPSPEEVAKKIAKEEKEAKKKKTN